MIDGLYIHIPFCEQICVYCDFHKEIATDKKKQQYIDRLIKSIDDLDIDFSALKTIFIGGGTPTNLDKDLLSKLLNKIANTISLHNIKEYSIEANPNDISLDKAQVLKDAGINRVSLGVQSFDKDILLAMNRSHQVNDIYTAIEHLKNVGIHNISIDLIFGFNNQTLKQVEYDLEQVRKLDIKHISTYALILEEKSVMQYLINKGKMRIVDEDLDYIMYNKIIDTLTDYGYTQYEISNFSKDGYESKHNMLYWTQGSYLGLGSGAHSYMDNKRFNMKPNVQAYIHSKNDQECISYYPSYGIEDALIFGLRLMKGLHIKTIENTYQISLLERYPVIKTFLEQEMLVEDNGYLHLTKKGLMLANNVFAAIMEDHHA